jgi:hypothetical protein
MKGKLDESDTKKGIKNKMWGKCGEDKTKKPPNHDEMRVFMTTKVVRTGTEPINFINFSEL